VPQGAVACVVDWTCGMDHACVMLRMSIIGLHRAVLLVGLAVALIGTGFAHRMPAPQDDALAFALATGASLADICGDQPDGSRKAAAPCLACHIAGTAELPPVQGTLIRLELAFVARVIAPRQSLARQRVLDPANSPQGPPVA
jgi:hypothetical protein